MHSTTTPPKPDEPRPAETPAPPAKPPRPAFDRGDANPGQPVRRNG